MQSKPYNATFHLDTNFSDLLPTIVSCAYLSSLLCALQGALTSNGSILDDLGVLVNVIGKSHRVELVSHPAS